MLNVVLVVHLLLALSLIGVVLLQRSEGGGLGIGGGAMGPQAGRPPLTGLAKLTWGFAAAFICTSIALTILGAAESNNTSVLDRFGDVADSTDAAGGGSDIPLPNLPLAPAPGTGTGQSGSAPVLPPRQDQ